MFALSDFGLDYSSQKMYIPLLGPFCDVNNDKLSFTNPELRIREKLANYASFTIQFNSDSLTTQRAGCNGSIFLRPLEIASQQEVHFSHNQVLSRFCPCQSFK